MIFCSRRVFLNVLTQLLDRDTLLNANYFLVDQIKPTGHAGFGEDIPRIGEDGSITYEPSMELDFNIPQAQGIHNYFIHYSDVLNLQAFFGATAASRKNDFSRPQDKVIARLRDTSTEISVYQEIFQPKLQGNGLQILIMQSDQVIQYCGHIICTFLSEVFGADINFIDPQYRPNVSGKIQYAGNKAYAQKHIPELRDAILRLRIDTMLDTVKMGGGYANLEAIFNSPEIGINELFHVYHLLFPNDQLPPGNYTTAHMKQLIIGRLMDATGKRAEMKTAKDLGFDFYAFDPVFDQYEETIAEDFSNIS